MCFCSAATRTQTELLFEVATEKIMLEYLRTSLFALAVEDLPGLVLAIWRLVYMATSSKVGLTFRLNANKGLEWDNLDTEQILPALQFLLSAILLGFQLCNIKEYTRLSAAHLKQETKLAEVVETASTELDTFGGVKPAEVTEVLRLRKTLGETSKRKAREVAGDVMLLRYIRGAAPSGINYQEGEMLGGSAVGKTVALAASVTSSLRRREESGANSVRDRILRDDLVCLLISNLNCRRIYIARPAPQ